MNPASPKPQQKLALHSETIRLLKQGASSRFNTDPDPLPTQFPPCAPVTAFL